MNHDSVGSRLDLDDQSLLLVAGTESSSRRWLHREAEPKLGEEGSPRRHGIVSLKKEIKGSSSNESSLVSFQFIFVFSNKHYKFYNNLM